MRASDLKNRIQTLAKELGYLDARVAPTELEPVDIQNLNAFVNNTVGTGLSWMERHQGIRINPGSIFPDAKSALVLASPYFSREGDELVKSSSIKISRYALGKDYHRVLRKKGQSLLDQLTGEFPEIRGRVVSDSAPVPEKILGRLSGLGWQGKNTNLIHPGFGSYFFISVIFLNQELAGDGPMADRCGRCTACEEHCPTGALQNGTLDPTRCISYRTIEEKDGRRKPENGVEGSWVFGCDICQEVCPWNSPGKTGEEFTPADFFPREVVKDWLQNPGTLSPDRWEKISKSSVLSRPGLERFNHSVEQARLWKMENKS